ncbi:MAG: hydrogenase maturation nickel metallochaperone HypA [Methanosarcinales archaeon Met12]|nr:MAG: hydrogenase maturation nickel metallochaperone HypA [Methanosarcinales archaeon Met12]
MHEYGVAMEVYKAVMDAASKNDAIRVISIYLELGELTHINSEQLSFCFEIIAKESLAEGADLNIMQIPPTIKCKCGYEGVLDSHNSSNCDDTKQYRALSDLALSIVCPECENSLPGLISGREINVRDIKIEVGENA